MSARDNAAKPRAESTIAENFILRMVGGLDSQVRVTELK